MARYDILEAGFSSLDETINFGTRAVGDSTNLYEIVTIAVIRSSETNKTLDPVKIISEYQQENIFFSADKTLRILKDKDISDEIGSFDFDNIIDTFCISTCGKFIVICTSNGTITIKTLLTGPSTENSFEKNVEFPTVFEEKLDDSSVEGYFKGSFFHDCSFYIVTSNGIVKRISIDTDEGNNYLFKSEISCDLRANINICAFVYPYLCLEGIKIIVLNLSNGLCQTDMALGLQGLQAIEFHFFGYDPVGNMYKIYPQQLLIFSLNDKFPGLCHYFEDVLLIHDGDKKSKLHVLGVTKDLPPKYKQEIQLQTYPGADVVYSIPLEGPIHVINIKDPSEDVICFTEIRKNNFLTEIRLQVIVKADPEFRLRKLLQKQLFDDAEVFAKTFNISPQIIAQAKARNIINKIICTTKDIDQLLEILDTIGDPLFKLNCCDTVDCEVGTDTRRVFCYGAFMDITVRDCSENKDNVLLVKKINFNDKVHRYDTYMQMYEKYDPATWKYFVDCDLISEMKTFLRKWKIEEASVIFNRMDRNTVTELTPLDIEEISSMLNKDLLTMKPFLTTFIPISLKYVPDSFVIFVRWLHDRVLQSEQQASDFPECAIKLVKETINLMDLTTPGKKHLHMEDWQSLAYLLKALEDLGMLLNQFSIRFPLTEYLTNPFSIIRTLLSVNNDSAIFETLIKDFICPFILKSNLDMDIVLLEEIKNLLVYEEEYWINIVPILLKFVTSIENKLDIAFKILEVTDIPWTNSVKDIARVTCELAPNYPIAETIMDHLTKEEILIIMRKYNIHKTQFEKLDDKIFYFKRMIYLDKDSVIEDIHHLCVDDNVRREADLLIIHTLVMQQNFEKAMNILDENSPEQIIALGTRILDRCFYFASAYELPKQYRDSYFILLNLVRNRLKKHAEGFYDKGHYEFDYKVASAVYGISEHFKLQINSTDLIRKKDDLLDTLVKQITDLYLRDDTFNIETFMVKCKQLAKFLDIDLETLFMKCLVNGKNFNPFLRLGQHLLDTSVCSKLLSVWAIYLLKYLKSNFIDDVDESLSDVFSNISKNHKNYILGIQLAKKLSIKAMMNATSEDHLAVMEVVRWIDSCFYLTSISRHLKNMDTLQIYHSNNALSKGVQSIEAIKSAFNIYCATLGPLHDNPSLKYLTYFTSNVSFNQEQLSKETERLTWNITTLLKEGQYLTCFNVIKTLQEGFLCNPYTAKDTLMMLQTVIKNSWLPKALEAVLSHKYIDKTLLLNLLLLSDKSAVHLWHYLQVYKRQPQKLTVITQVGLELWKYQKNAQGQLDLTNNLNLCKWWNRLTDKNINYDFFFTASCEDRLKTLISGKQVDLSNLPEYCSDFCLDLQKTYLLFLEMTLKCWQPKYKKITDVNGQINIVMQNDETKLDKECQNIIKNIINTDHVMKLVDRMWLMINFYYYEVFMVLLSIRSKLSAIKSVTFEQYQSLLLFLKNYKRVSSPTRSESENWFGSFPMKAFLDPLSEFRLPLTDTFFSSDIWTIIKPEVNLETYKIWFELVPILEEFLNTNDICTYAINSAMPGRHSGNVSYSWDWDLISKLDHVIDKVEECAEYITDLERATAAVYNLMCNMTPGVDQVKVAKLSYMYAQKYQASASSEDVTKIYIKVKHRYYNYSTICILHKYQLAEKKYLKLVSEPTELISKLYDDPRIPKHVSSVNFDCPDINSAVDDICTLFELIGKKIKLGELLKFLKSDSTLDLDRDAEDHRLLRAYYICESADFHKRLLKIGMNKDDAESMSVRANALKCFYYTSTVDSLETMSTMAHEEFLTYMNKVSLVAKLEDLGFKITVEELDQFNKKKLSKQLAEVNKPLAIKCIASVCKIYELDDLMYWKFIVNSAIRFNMIKDLCEYVEYLRFRCVTDFIINAWNAIIADAFKMETNYIAALILLQTCPVIYALNFENYIQKCLFHKRPEIAAMLFQYVSAEKHELYIKCILPKKTIFKDVAGLKDEGILGTDKVLKILGYYRE